MKIGELNNRPNKPFIAVMGTPVSSGNRGVMALGTSLVYLCLAARPETQVVFMVGNKDNLPVNIKIKGVARLIPVINYRMSPRSHLKTHLLWITLMALLYRLLPFPAVQMTIARLIPWIKTIREAEVVGDVRGGDSFSDIYGMKRFLLGFLPIWTVLQIRKEIVLFPQTYGPYNRRLSKILARFIMKRASTIIARDKESQKLAQEMIGHSKEVILSPDVAFVLESTLPARIKLNPPASAELIKKAIGLNVNGLMYNGGYNRQNMFGLKLEYSFFLEELLTALLKEHPADLVLIPHTYAPAGNVESDNEACRRLRDVMPEELKKRIYMVAEEYDQHELKGIIGQCDFFIGSRMHSCIAALSQGIPCVGVAYSKKFVGVFDSVAMVDWVIDGRQFSSGEAVNRIMKLYRRRAVVREHLLENAEKARERLKTIFGNLLKEKLLTPAILSVYFTIFNHLQIIS